MTDPRPPGTLDRREAVACLLADPGGLLVVTGLGSAAYDAAAAGDRAENFYLWGAMGGAAMVGLGLALARPDRHVLVLTGDGEMLMGLGSLATLAAQRLANLSVAVLDNSQFGETGQQRSHTGLGTDLTAVAAACGWATAAECRDMAQVRALAPRLRRQALFAVLRIAPGEVPRHLPPRDGAALATRLRASLGLAHD